MGRADMKILQLFDEADHSCMWGENDVGNTSTLP